MLNPGSSCAFGPCRVDPGNQAPTCSDSAPPCFTPLDHEPTRSLVSSLQNGPNEFFCRPHVLGPGASSLVPAAHFDWLTAGLQHRPLHLDLLLSCSFSIYSPWGTISSHKTTCLVAMDIGTMPGLSVAAAMNCIIHI